MALRRQLPDARLFVAPDSTHVVLIRQPALFNAAALGFWRSIGALGRDGMSATVRVDLPASDPGGGAALPGVALVTIDRPAALNALDRATMSELLVALRGLDLDDDCRCVVLTGAGERAFAAGADIREMADRTTADIRADDFLAPWDQVAGIATPVIAAVRGFCLGGGFELALACDIIVAAEDAVFGLPEITLGIMPGAGGTQRLTRIVGKSRAMELILTGARIPASDAERWGIVSRVVPAGVTAVGCPGARRDHREHAARRGPGRGGGHRHGARDQPPGWHRRRASTIRRPVRHR